MEIVIIAVVLLFFLKRSPGTPGVDYPTQNQVAANGVPPSGGPGGVCGFLENHVARKDALAPTIASSYTGLPSSVTKPLTAVLSKADLSGYAENAISKAACSGAIGKFFGGIGSGVAAAGKFVAHEAVAGAKAVGTLAVNSVKDPGAPLNAGANLAASVSGNVSRAADAAYNKLPAPLKLAAVPAVAAVKVTATVAAAGQKVTGALTSGAKAATSAVSSAANKVLGWL